MALRPVDSYASVYALAEHVELSKSGWWEDAIDHIIQSLLYLNIGGLTEEDLVHRTQQQLDAKHDRPLIRRRIEALENSGVLVSNGHTNFLAENKRADYAKLSAEAQSLEEVNKLRYEKITGPLRERILGIPSWPDFTRVLLIPVINELGARTMELIRGEMPVPRTEAYSKFLSAFKDEDKASVQSLVISFLDPTEPQVRKFILGYLNHYMLIKSSSLDKKTLDRMQSSNGARPKFRIVLDTNILFSILDLHYNPANDAARALLELTKSVQGYVDIEFQCLTRTIDEAKASLSNARLQAPRGRMTRALAQSARDVGEISGLVGRYIELVADGRAGSPSVYFGDLIDGLEVILEDQGISVISEDTEEIEGRQSFVEKVDSWVSSGFDKKSGRGRHRVSHDVLAMEYVGEKRKTQGASLIEVEWWFLTADFGLQTYEKRTSKRMGIPKSINPAELAQILRFWVPRSDYLESALIGGLRLPFSFFQGSDKMEKTSLEILDRLSRYTNVETFSSDLTERLLTNSVLRSAIENSKNLPESQEEAIESALADELESLQEAMDVLEEQDKTQAKLVEKLTQERDAALQKSSAKLVIESGKQTSKAKMQSELERSKRELEKERRKNRERDQEQAKQIQALTASLKEMKGDLETSREARRQKSVRLRQNLIVWPAVLLVLTTMLLVSRFIVVSSGWESSMIIVCALCALVASSWFGLFMSKLVSLAPESWSRRTFRYVSHNLLANIVAGAVALIVALVPLFRST